MYIVDSCIDPSYRRDDKLRFSYGHSPFIIYDPTTCCHSDDRRNLKTLNVHCRCMYRSLLSSGRQVAVWMRCAEKSLRIIYIIRRLLLSINHSILLLRWWGWRWFLLIGTACQQYIVLVYKGVKFVNSFAPRVGAVIDVVMRSKPIA